MIRMAKNVYAPGGLTRGSAPSCAVALGAAALLAAACAEHPESPMAPRERDATPAASMHAAQHTSAVVVTHPSLGMPTPISGARASVVSNDNGANFTLHTAGLVPGNAYTVWWVKIDAPENCAGTPCSGADVLGNFAGVHAEVACAAGHVAGASGRGTFAGHFSTGPVPGGWFGNVFTNPKGAEIHLIIMDHGPALPQLVASQISSLRGGCSDESVNTPPISGFPAVAKADGVPGPNTCRLVQLAILEQG